MAKDVQYKVISVLRKAVQYYPNFIMLEKRDILTKICINTILTKSELWTGVVFDEQGLNNVFPQFSLNASEQEKVTDYEIATLTYIIDTLVANGLGIGETPYCLIKILKVDYGLTENEVWALSDLVDYAMTINETFMNKPFDVLSACVLIHQSHKSTNELWITETLSNVSNNSVILKDLIEQNLSADMMP